ncbi:uncharacterized protein [Oryza sativa Japonica Group]|uniref:uncharacterized protein isoform X1 n=1 Tax=Oryza sativa subsp. japonica TaxID=39947 RepID=UPI00339BD408
MAPPIARNGRTIPGCLPWPPAAIPVAVPPSPVLGSLPSAIKWNPLAPFYRFSPLPRSPVVPSHLPAVVPSLPRRRPPPAACATPPAHRLAVPSPSPASQPPPLPRRRLRFVGKSPETRPRRLQVALPPLYRLRPAAVHRRCADRRRRLLLRHRGIVSFPGITSSSPEARRSGLLVGVQYLPVSGRLLYVAGTPIDVAISSVDVAVLSSPPAAPLFRRNAVARAGLHPRRRRRPFGRPVHPRRLVISRCRLRRRIHSGAFHVVPVSVQLPPAALVVSSPAPVVVIVVVLSSSSSSWHSSLRRAVLVRRPRSSSVPLQPRRRLRPWLRVVKPRAGRVSLSSKDRRRSRPLAVRLRCARLSPPRPFVVVVPTPRRVVACSFACVLRVAFVVPEVPEAWFVVVAEGSEGRSL